MKREKKYLVYGIGLVLLTFIGVSLAYFSTEIVGDKKNVSVNTADLRIIFNGGDSINGSDIEPGWSETKTFSVENKTKSDYDYNIVIKDLVNTVKSYNYLVYKITSTDGGYNMEEYRDIPKSSEETDTTIAYSITIPSKSTHNYTIEIKYINDINNEQNSDIGTTLSGKLFISEGTEVPPTLVTAMLRDNPTVSERNDFSVTNTENTTGTIYKTNKTEDDSTVYYYSGNTTNNWVKFGKETKSSCTYNGSEVEYAENGSFSNMSSEVSEEICGSTNVCILSYNGQNEYVLGFDSLEGCEEAFESLGSPEASEITITYSTDKATYYYGPQDIYWRITRTNEDGSVRLLYAGNRHNTLTGYISTSEFNSYSYESRFVGYMYGGNTSLEDNRNNTMSSTVKIVLDKWYKSNLLVGYDKYISKSSIYCNDRSISSGTWVNTVGTSFSFYFGACTRLVDNKTPTYKCGENTSGGLFESTQATQDKFSASTTGGGNGQLTFPIALMTADEISFAGGVWNANLSSPYAWYILNSVGGSITGYGDGFWMLMSPFTMINYGSYILGVKVDGELRIASVNYPAWIRPAISIDACAKVTGTGTSEDPYIIDESASTC